MWTTLCVVWYRTWRVNGVHFVWSGTVHGEVMGAHFVWCGTGHGEVMGYTLCGVVQDMES